MNLAAHPFLESREVSKDSRGESSRLFSAASLGQINVNEAYILSVTNVESGTLRGLHGQRQPFEENKILTVTKGAIFDLCIDLRENSPTFGFAFSCEISAETPATLFIPSGFVHGYQTLTENTELVYAIDSKFNPDFQNNFNPRSRSLENIWPLQHSNISASDNSSQHLAIKITSFCSVGFDQFSLDTQ